MSFNYYDVVVLGMELGPLVAGALLARRGFRVLVVGQGGSNDNYSCWGYRFVRRPFLFSGLSSPVVRRILSELTLGQLFQRILVEQEPRYQVVLPGARIDVFRDIGRTVAELTREIPDSSEGIRDVLHEIGRLSTEFEKLLDNDLVIPPETFFERREFSRAEVQNPFHMTPDVDLFARLGVSGDLMDFLNAPVAFETGGGDRPAPLAAVRQMGAWMFDCQRVQDGRDALRKLLCERIVGQGGDVQAGYTVTGIELARGKVHGIRMVGREEPTGCQIVLTDLSPRELAPLVAPSLWPKRFKALVDDDHSPVLGYSLNLGVSPEVIPAGMCHTGFISTGKGLGADLLRVEVVPGQMSDKAVLHVSCIVPPGQEETIATGALRDSILDRMRWLVPFLDTHLKVLHSPYDGFGPMDLTGAATGIAPPVPHQEEIPRWLVRRPPGGASLGVENLPHRTGIKGLFLAGGQVVSGLSTEGEMLAGWGAARIAGKLDPTRQRVVRSMRNKVEI